MSETQSNRGSRALKCKGTDVNSILKSLANDGIYLHPHESHRQLWCPICFSPTAFNLDQHMFLRDFTNNAQSSYHEGLSTYYPYLLLDHTIFFMAVWMSCRFFKKKVLSIFGFWPLVNRLNRLLSSDIKYQGLCWGSRGASWVQAGDQCSCQRWGVFNIQKKTFFLWFGIVIGGIIQTMKVLNSKLPKRPRRKWW